MRRRGDQRSEFSLGVLTTVLTVLVVVILLAATFVADWLRVPQFELSADAVIISPNGDRDHDVATASYNLTEDARVTAQVLSEGGGVARLLLQDEMQPAGQHFVNWDGYNELGSVVEDGRYRLQIIARGSMRGNAKDVVLQVDTRPPPLQLANLENGMRVGESALLIQGVTEPDALVWIGGEPQPLSVDTQGRFVFQHKLAEGSNLLEVRAVDQAGNSNRLLREVVLVTTPPDVTITRPADGAWTNQAILNLEGVASPSVTVSVNDQPVTVNEDGEFTYELLLEEGENQVRIQASDDVGNLTQIERLVHLKTQPPDVRLNFAEGVEVSDSLFQVSGRTEPGVTVLVNGRIIPVSALGDFQASTFLSEGDNLVEIVARDQAGNVTTLSRRVRLGPAQASSGVARMWRNLAALPSLFIPALLAASLLLALFLLRQNQVSLMLSVEQSTFTPGFPGENRVLELLLELNKPARVTLEVIDQSGVVRATLLNNRRRSARQHLFYWDGYDDYGNPMRPGDYTVQATAGLPPVRVSSAVQLAIMEDPSLHRRAGQGQYVRRRGEY
ncbi:MAG: hypothetical protein JXA78_12125 [Anaerolineales bacterium]|nr:hypothetical protein [Anaerolineales bacterium]